MYMTATSLARPAENHMPLGETALADDCEVNDQRPERGDRSATSAAALGGRDETLGNNRVSTTFISVLQVGTSASRMFAALPVAG